jgi:hypothetical protein
MSKYNGWSNYATWRVYIEFFDGTEGFETDREFLEMSEYDRAKYLQAMVVDFIDDELTQSKANSMISGWVNAWIEDVNFLEIAQHLIEE